MIQVRTLFLLTNVVILLLFSTACQKDTGEFTEDDAAEMMQTFLQSNTGGASQLIEEAAKELMTNATTNGVCDVNYNDNFNFAYNGLFIQTNFDIGWDYSMSCVNSVLTTASFSINTSGNFSTSKVTSTNTASVTMDVAGLAPTALNLGFGGSFTYSGNQEFTKGGTTKFLATTISVSLANVLVDKSNYDILSGTASVMVSGGGTGIDKFSYAGTVTFNGNGTATLDFHGLSITFNLEG